MRCPYCRNDNDRVVDSRAAEDSSVIRRRRECVECGKRYTTYERVEDIPLRVVKKNGSRVPFDRTKILAGLHKACEKRPISTERAEKLVSEVEREIHRKFEKEVNAKDVGELVINKLQDLDEVAYVRFASVYRQFKDVSHFMKEIKHLLK